jgi:hypothetical protein
VSDPDLPALAPDALADLRAGVRSEIRRWLTADGDAAVLARIDAIGAGEIEAAAALAGRTAAALPEGRATALLDELNRLVNAIHTPPPAPRRLFGAPPPPPPVERRLADAEPALAHLLEELAGERDRLAQAALVAERLDARIEASEAELARAAHRLRLLAQAAEAAGRELGSEQPARARFLAGEAAARATERASDVLTQLAVLRQTRLSLHMLAEGQAAMVRAVDRTRHIMVSALRAGVAAARAVGEGARLADRAAALDAGAARQAAEAAVGEMRAALADR